MIIRFEKTYCNTIETNFNVLWYHINLDEMDRRRRSILNYPLPSYGNSPFMQIEDESAVDDEGEGNSKVAQ